MALLYWQFHAFFSETGNVISVSIVGLSGWLSGKKKKKKNLPANAGDLGSVPGWGDPLEKEIVTIPVYFPGKSHGQRSQLGSSPGGCKEVDVT